MLLGGKERVIGGQAIEKFSALDEGLSEEMREVKMLPQSTLES